VGVVGRDPVRELVEVGLADVDVAGRLEQCNRLGRGVGDVVGEDRRAVGGADAGGVEQVLDRKPGAGCGPRCDLGDEDPVDQPSSR